MSRLVRVSTLLTLMLAAGGAQAALRCTVSATSMDFGLYSPLAAAPHDTTGTVTAVCRGGLGFLRFQLSPGNSGDATNRLLLSGGNPLSYNIYRNTARTQIWGDGTGGTVEAFGLQYRRGRLTHNISAYGRIPAGQNAAAGFYTDDIVVTVIF